MGGVCRVGNQWAQNSFAFHRPPTQIPVSRLLTMAMRDDLTAILAAAEVPKEFTEYLVTKGLCQSDQLALMASDENRLEDKIFPIAKHGMCIMVTSVCLRPLHKGRWAPVMSGPTARVWS